MRIAIAIIGAALLCMGCSGKTADANQAQSAASPPPVRVMVTAAKLAPITRTLTAYGTVEYSPDGARRISVQAEEVVTQLLVAVGQPVSRGDSLLTLEPSANARLELDKARIEVQFAHKEVQRLDDLRQRQLATNTDVQAAEKYLATAEVALANIARRHEGGGPHVVRANVAGTVQTVTVQVGQVVAPGAPLVTIGNRDRLRVKLGLEQDDLARIHIGQRVEVVPINSAETPISSTVEKIYRQIDPTTRLADAVIPLPRAHGLLPGAMVRAEIVVEANPHALVVPRSAVLSQQGKSYVFVDDHGHARERPVETGEDNGKVIEIRKGLVAGQSVVTVGNAELTAGMALHTEPQK
ncbi:efflux RND transporter periplasmic adaptor subunit [Paraburkholderia sp. 40]|uniref:efflux RND transporter periplasmic adaptor subunit n=1 Tax=unclassified Paraburkholderia TaxID=2615204 RepID=UPI003D251FFC